jgi:predicted Fe-Mo cluster-binding NifX family protein
MKEHIIAIALTKNMIIPDKHFGECDKFFIYRIKNGMLEFFKSIPNIYRDMDIDSAHGDPEKGKSITELLTENNVNAVISRQFGKNLSIISNHFHPIFVKESKLEIVVELIQKEQTKIVSIIQSGEKSQKGKFISFKI